MSVPELSDQALVNLVRQIRALGQRAEREYQPMVDAILRSGTRDIGDIERTLDRLLDFCDNESILAMYKDLCRYYWHIDRAGAAYYVGAYRERWDTDEPGDVVGSNAGQP